MPCKKKGKKHRAHTPITSEAQQGGMGSAYGRKKAGKGKSSKTPAPIWSISMADLRSHLKEAGGKKLPQRVGKKKKKSRKR